MSTHPHVESAVRVLGSTLLVCFLFIPNAGIVEARNAAGTPACIRFVNINSIGSTEDGLAWGTAYKNLEIAINNTHNAIVASPALAPCDIWVAKGTYTLSGLSFFDSFLLWNDIRIYGGFSGNGTETDLSQRNWQTNETILSGERGDPAIKSDNYYNVVYSSGGNNTGRLDGFTILNGYARGSGSDGGGISIVDSSPALSNLHIRYNHADVNGGGIYLHGSSSVLTNVYFNNNDAHYGGGAYITGSSSVRMQIVTFLQNTATVDGGGLYNDLNNTGLDLDFTYFYSNEADHGGGGAYIYGPANLEKLFFNWNLADFGAGMLIDHGSAGVVMTNSVLASNIASQRGGGLYLYSNSPTLVGLLFCYNGVSTDVYGTGGAISNYQSSPILTNVTITENEAAQGGGIYNTQNSHPVIQNSILWGDFGGEYANDSINGTNYFSTSYSLVQGCNPAGEWNTPACNTDGGNNLKDVSPAFLAAPTGDYRLSLNSPVIDKGNNAFLGSVTYDLDYHARIFGGRVDLGPYELIYYKDFLPLISR